MINVLCASAGLYMEPSSVLFNRCLFYSQTGAIDRSQDIMMQIDHTRLRDCETLYTPEKLVCKSPRPGTCQDWHLSGSDLITEIYFHRVCFPCYAGPDLPCGLNSEPAVAAHRRSTRRPAATAGAPTHSGARSYCIHPHHHRGRGGGD